VKPAPLSFTSHLKSGYLLEGKTLEALALKAGIDSVGLKKTVEAFNPPARRGEDPAFGRGANAFNRYLADPLHQPNPCVAPIESGPYYAVKLIMGDLGTFDGLRTAATGEVLRPGGEALPGLFAVGNDRASIMGGNYPAAGITHGPNMALAFATANHIADLAQRSAAVKAP
jgi:FAD binding domain